jgi:hypothetical protein
MAQTVNTAARPVATERDHRCNRLDIMDQDRQREGHSHDAGKEDAAAASRNSGPIAVSPNGYAPPLSRDLSYLYDASAGDCHIGVTWLSAAQQPGHG